MAASLHPSPLLERSAWRNLNGTWRFAYDPLQRWTEPDEVLFDRQITVPFPPESAASGLGDAGFHNTVWYAKTVELTDDECRERGRSPLLLHFGAVDYRATVWINGQLLAKHEGGHTPFSLEISQRTMRSRALEVVVKVEDDSADLHQPRGKQTWRDQPHAIWYPRTTGIWQTVWLECVPETRLAQIDWRADTGRWSVSCDLEFVGPLEPRSSVRVRLSLRGQTLCDDRIELVGNHLSRQFNLPDPGIEEERRLMMWSPEHPHLIDAHIELLDLNGCVIDAVSSYTAMRSIGHDGQRLLLNGAPYYLRMVLDQGYWPDSLMAATDEQLKTDVELTKQLGFNAVRKHQKVESPRWLYHCDVFGLLVWEEMPSHYAFSSRAVERLNREWVEVIKRDRSHPCIMAWVPFNESWGVPELLRDPAQQHYVQAIYHLTKTLDPSRLAITNDGWEFAGGDWLGIHDYTDQATKLVERYLDPPAIQRTLERPWGRPLRTPKTEFSAVPVVLSEFGGIAFDDTHDNWGYSRASSGEEFLARYTALLDAVHACRSLAGFCYTQLTDTFGEHNGLLSADRQPKVPISSIAAATRGERDAHETEIEGSPNPLGYSRRWYADLEWLKPLITTNPSDSLASHSTLALEDQ